MYVLLHPLQELALIKQADVEVAILADSFSGEETPKTNAIVEVNKDYPVARGLDETRAVPVGVGIARVAAALDEDHDRELHVGGGVGGRPDVGEEAVLIVGVLVRVGDAETDGRELLGLLDVLAVDRLRR